MQLVEGSAMRAPWAEDRRASGQIARLNLHRWSARRFRQETGTDGALAHDMRIKLTRQGKDALTFNRDPQQAHPLLDERVQLFNDDQALHGGGESLDLAAGQGPGHAEVQYRSGLRRPL